MPDEFPSPSGNIESPSPTSRIDDYAMSDGF